MDKSIRKLAVIGAGTMGAAIAACGARAGLDVVLMVRGKAEESGRERAQKAIAAILKSGEMTIMLLGLRLPQMPRRCYNTEQLSVGQINGKTYWTGTIMQTNEIMDQLCPEISPRTPICTGFATHLIALLMTPAPAGQGLLLAFQAPLSTHTCLPLCTLIPPLLRKYGGSAKIASIELSSISFNRTMQSPCRMRKSGYFGLLIITGCLSVLRKPPMT